MTTEFRDIVERLEEWANELADPKYLQFLPEGHCGSDLLREAVTNIIFLRRLARAVTDGPSFAEIAKDLPRKPTDEEVKYNPHPARTGYYGTPPK